MSAADRLDLLRHRESYVAEHACVFLSYSSRLQQSVRWKHFFAQRDLFWNVPISRLHQLVGVLLKSVPGTIWIRIIEQKSEIRTGIPSKPLQKAVDLIIAVVWLKPPVSDDDTFFIGQWRHVSVSISATSSILQLSHQLLFVGTNLFNFPGWQPNQVFFVFQPKFEKSEFGIKAKIELESLDHIYTEIMRIICDDEWFSHEGSAPHLFLPDSGP